MTNEGLRAWLQELQATVDDHLAAERGGPTITAQRLDVLLARYAESHGGVMPAVIWLPVTTLPVSPGADSLRASDGWSMESSYRGHVVTGFRGITLRHTYGPHSVCFAPEWWPTAYAIERSIADEEDNLRLSLRYHERTVGLRVEADQRQQPNTEKRERRAADDACHERCIGQYHRRIGWWKGLLRAGPSFLTEATP